MTHRELIGRLERYHALLNAAISHLQLIDRDQADELMREIEEAI